MAKAEFGENEPITETQDAQAKSEMVVRSTIWLQGVHAGVIKLVQMATDPTKRKDYEILDPESHERFNMDYLLKDALEKLEGKK